jgi:translocation and assembly module TamB
LRAFLRRGALACTFVSALAAGLSLHAGTHAVRTVAREVGERALAGLFDGRIRIGDVSSLSIGRTSSVHIANVIIEAPDGTPVIEATDVRGSIALVTLLRSLVRGAPIVDLPDASVGSSEILIDKKKSIAAAFGRNHVEKNPSAPSGGSTGSPSKEPTLRIHTASVGHAHVHGDVITPPLDADADDVHASIALVEGKFAVDWERARVTMRSPKLSPERADTNAAASGHFGFTLGTATFEGRADANGTFGKIPFVAHAELAGDEVSATLDVPKTDAEAVRAAFPMVPLDAPVSAHASAKGRWPTLAVDGRGTIGDATWHTSGEVAIRDRVAYTLDGEVARLDARAFGAPARTDVTGSIHVDGNGSAGTFRLRTESGFVDAETIPAASIEGRFEEKQVTVNLRASEPGIDASGNIVLDVPTRVATFDLQARSPSLRASPRTMGKISGAGSVRAVGKIELESRTVRATVNASLDGVSADALSAKHLAVSGNVRGPISSPAIDVGFAGRDVAVTAPGKDPLVYPNANGRAKIVLAPSLQIVDASIDITGRDVPIHASAASIHVRDGAVEARGLSVEGLGEPLAIDVHTARDAWALRIKSAGVDMKRLRAMTGIAQLAALPDDTRAELDIDLRRGPAGADGRFDVVVRSEKLLGDGSVVTEAHGTVDRGKLVGHAKLAAEGLGTIEIQSAEVQLPSDLDVLRATGVIELRGDIDLSKGAALFAGESIEQMEGIARFEGRIERGDPKAWPAVRVTARTNGLSVVMSDPASSAPSTKIKGVDLLAHAEWDGRTDDGEASIIAWDGHGLLASAGAKARIPLSGWARGTAPFDGKALGDLVVNAAFDAPSRQIANLPEFLHVLDVRGQLGASVRVTGPLAKPTATAHISARGLKEDRKRAADTSQFAPLDGALDATFDGERAAITIALDERERRRAAAKAERGRKHIAPEPGRLRGLVLVDGARVRDVLLGAKLKDMPWKASTEIELTNVNIGGLPIPGQHALSGALTGRIRLRDIHASPSFEAHAHIDGFGASGATVENVDLDIGGRDASLFAHANIVDTTGRDPTNVRLQLASQSLRLRGVHVDWDPQAATRLDYAIQNGRLALLAPLVKNQVSELAGRIDGAGSVSIEEAGQTFEGGLAVTGARLYVNAVGDEVSGLDAVARFDRSGTWRIDEAKGKLGTGELRATASGRMKGFSFIEADAQLMTGKEPIPISSESATFAEATGEVHLRARMSDDRSALLLTLDVPRANVELPDKDTQKLEPLERDTTIAIGVRHGAKLDTRAVRRDRGGTGAMVVKKTNAPERAIRATVALGDDVHLEGRGLDVMLGGRTIIALEEELAVTGRIDLRGGTIVVHGRRFTVDRGTVTFPDGGDPANPVVIAAAYWDAPDRTRVWVEFVGPLKTGKLTLRSEPAYSKNEILSVLLFGRPDPNTARQSNKSRGDASGATAVGTGLVAGDLNRMLSQIDENLDIETDTLAGNRARTKLGRSFFDRRLKVQVGYAPGQTYREPDTTFLFVNWQFLPKWSVVATRGNKGTSILDVLFQHRY